MDGTMSECEKVTLWHQLLKWGSPLAPEEIDELCRLAMKGCEPQFAGNIFEVDTGPSRKRDHQP